MHGELKIFMSYFKSSIQCSEQASAEGFEIRFVIGESHQFPDSTDWENVVRR